MINGMLKRIVSLFLIASPLWWMSGCYTFTEITKLNKAKDIEIEVLTKENVRYKFEHWAVDSLGAIRGVVRWDNPAFKSPYDRRTGREVPNGEPRYLEGQRCIPKDSVASISAVRPDYPPEAAVALGLAVGTILTFLVLVWSGNIGW